MQRQAVRAQSLRQDRKELLGIVLALEQHDEIVRDGARRMLAGALQAEVADYIARHAGLVDEAGHRLVVRNGYRDERDVLTAAGAYH